MQRKQTKHEGARKEEQEDMEQGTRMEMKDMRLGIRY